MRVGDQNDTSHFYKWEKTVYLSLSISPNGREIIYLSLIEIREGEIEEEEKGK